MGESILPRRTDEASPLELIEVTRPLREPHLLVAPDGEILAANPAAVRDVGVRVPASGRPLKLGDLTEDSREHLEAFLRAAGRTTGPVPGAITVQRSDGSARRFAIEGGLVRPGRGVRSAVILIRARPHSESIPGFLQLNDRIGDLTRALHERRVAEKALQERADQLRSMSLELRRQRDAAEAANLAKTRFIASMSHELRTPLSTITGYVELLILGISGPLLAEQLAKLETVQRTTEHLVSIINDILSFARDESDHPSIASEHVDLNSVIDEAVEMIRPALDDSGIELMRVLPEGPVLVTTDAVKVRQIVLNLLSNAAKFTRGGEVIVSLEPGDDSVLLSVADNGIGIAEEDQERIFESFWQAEVGLGGAGLGLALTHQIVRRLGGDIRVQSELGKGSTFTVMLPREVPPVAKAEAAHTIAD